MPNINTGNDIFESINAKGRRLNNLDLLKNLLCKRLENKLEEFDSLWNNLVDNLIYDKENNLFLDPNTFLCDYIYARYGENKSKEKVYSYLRKKTNDFSEKEVVEFVEEIGEMAKLISTIKSIYNYESDLWSILMLDVLNVKQMTPIIMVCSKMEDENLKNEVLKSFFNLSFLKVVHGGIKDEHRIEVVVKRHLERGNNTLVGFTDEESENIIEDIQKIIEEYENEYNNSPEIWLDEKYSNKSAASIIYTIERTAFYTEDNNSLSTNKLEKNKMEKVYSAEHILAHKFNDEKNKAKAEQSYVDNGYFKDYEQLKSSINRLGNYTILSKRLNSNLGDTSLKNKREHYNIQSGIQFYITRILCEDLGKENSKKLKVNRRIKDSSSILFVEDFSKKDDVTYEMIEERTRNLLDIIFKIMLEKSKKILG